MKQNPNRILVTRRMKIGIILMGSGSFLMVFGFHFAMMSYIDWDTGHIFVGLGNIIFILGIIMLYLVLHKTINLNSLTER